MIVARGRDNSIGKDGDLLWHLSADLKHFKALTMGHAIVMGRRTWESLPKGALPGRRNIVVSRNETYNAPGAEVYHSLEDAVAAAGEDAFIIGGGRIYEAAMPYADTLYLTEVDAEYEDADTHFPELDGTWRLVEEESAQRDERSGLTYRFVTLRR